jgi:RNA polymerase sigma-70 factor (ECF subfamily)
MPETAFQMLVNANYGKVFYHCLKLVRNSHDAADITQNTFLKAFLNYNSVRKQESLEPWLFAVCNNEIKQFCRSRPKEHPMHEPPQDTQTDPNHNALYAAIDRLPEPQRQVILLKYFGGYTMQELALALSVNFTTVKSRLYEARQAIKKMLNVPAVLPSLPKERRITLMSILNLCAAGAKTVPCLSLHAQKQLLQCAKDNVKFNEAVLAELANIPSGQDFLTTCHGSLSYDELVKVLACCDEATLYRMAGQDFKTWRSAPGNELIGDVAALFKTGGYVDSVEMILYVPSIIDTVRWYKKILNWNCGETEEAILARLKNSCHTIIHPYSNESAQDMAGRTGEHPLRQKEDGAIRNCGCFVFVSGLEALRSAVIENGWTQIGEITS